MSMSRTYVYTRHVIGSGDSLEVSMHDEIVSTEPHPDRPDKLIVWIRTQQHNTAPLGGGA